MPARANIPESNNQAAASRGTTDDAVLSNSAVASITLI